MILDTLLMFDPPATVVTATAVSTNIIDLLNARDMGIGDAPALKLVILVGTTMEAAGSATLQIQAQGSTDSSTWLTLAESRAYALASLTANRKLFPIDWPVIEAGATGPSVLHRYLRLNYIVATGPMTAGTIQAYLSTNRDDQVSYPKNFTA